jgi:TRAP-type mannitol/chloroaromatic compound transport system substrate-binding protein
MFVGQKHYDALPAEYKAALHAGCAEGNTWMMAKYDAQNPAALRRLVAGGTQLRPFPRAVMDACYKAAMERFAEESAKNPKWKKIYDNYMAFYREQLLWFRVTENTYDNYMATAGQQQTAPAKK